MSDEQPRDRPDGFRPRRIRPKGWLKKAIERGEVADPAKGPQPPIDYPEGATVFRVPVAEAEAKGTED